jgi:hypothetical protein
LYWWCSTVSEIELCGATGSPQFSNVHNGVFNGKKRLATNNEGQGSKHRHISLHMLSRCKDGNIKSQTSSILREESRTLQLGLWCTVLKNEATAGKSASCVQEVEQVMNEAPKQYT